MSSCLVGARWVSNLSVRPDWQETKKRKKSMQTKTNRRGLAIGAAIALVGSFFGAAPASYASTDGANITIRPLSNDGVTNFTGLLSEDFPVYAQLLPGTANANNNFANGKLLWEIERVSGNLDVLAVVSTVSSAVGNYSGAITDATTRLSASTNVVWPENGFTNLTATRSSFVSVWATSTSATIAARVSTDATGYAPLYIRAATSSGITSVSPTLTVKVTAFIDEIGGQNGVRDSGEWFTTKTITLKAFSAFTPTLTLGTPAARDTVVTASATLNEPNWSNLNGNLFLAVSTSDTTAVFTKTAGNTTTVTSSAIAGATALARGGVVSESFDVNTLTESTTISLQLRYVVGTPSTIYSGDLLGTTTRTAVVSVPGVSSLSVSATAGANILGGGTSYTIRPNQTYTLRVLASSGSANASISTNVTIVLTGTGLVTSSKLVSINGGSFLTAYPADGFTVATGTNGVGTFTLATSGFVSGDHLSVSAKIGNVTSGTAVRLTVANPTYTVVADNALVATTPGTAVNLGFSVEDQWGELSSATNQFLKVTRGGSGFNYATTVSYHAVSAGVATVAFTPESATATGSATVEADIVKLENGAYIDEGTDADVTITVTSTANAFATGLAASRAASVSYFPSTVSWVTVTGYVTVSGSVVNVTGDSTLVFRGATSATSSGAVSVFANSSGMYSFQVAALRSGTKTITLTNGAATTTSLIVVADAASDMGRTIAWDTTTIEAGKTRVITGTLTDANGNPVDTTGVGRTAGDSGTASIVVTYTGTAGIVVGTMPTETDADGKFKVSVLTAAADSGTLTITAVYMPQGASTVAANKVTSVQAVTVAPAAAPEVNAVIGSFLGRWAVRVENAKGSVVAVKVGGNWYKYTALNDNYLFSRKSRVGATVAVSVWVDGELQNSQTITVR